MPKRHIFGLKNEILPLIENGRKLLEIRVADTKRKKVRIGDDILFCQKVLKRVVRIRSYRTFIEMLKYEPLEQIMPDLTKQEILMGLQKIYTPEQEALGVLVSQLRVDI